MEEVEFAKNLIKIFFINLFVYYVYIKIIDYEKVSIFKNISVIGINGIIAGIYVLLERYFYSMTVVIIINIIYGIILACILKNKIYYSVIIVMISFIITYIIYLISVIIAGNLLMMIPQVSYNSFISLFTILIITASLVYLTLKIKRIRKGFNFLKNININQNILVFVMLFSGITISIFGLLQKLNTVKVNTFLFTGTILIAISLIIWIKSQITKTYKNRMRDRTIEMQKAEIDEQARIMDELKAENLKLASAIHKYNKKISALEFAMKNAVESGVNTEFANEISVILEETKEASKNFAKETGININKLPLTNNVGIDNMFKYMQEEARKKDINFDLKLNTSIKPLFENIISKDKFETLIGDHLKDAIIAVDARGDSFKSILATLGVVDGIYEFSVYDTGIEFEINTLLKLGKEQITTHKEEGGSGIGFMTTFETLKECKASLIIEEYNPDTTNYTKAVIIRFDGKNQYKIYSYRAEEIKKQNKGRRISIKQLR